MFYNIETIIEFVASEGYNHCLLEPSAHNLCKQIGRKKASVQIWIQAI